MRASEILSKAAERTEQQWGQGPHLTMDCCCALEAIADVSERGSDRDDAIELLREVIGAEGVARWNDAEGRTKAEVVTALRKASQLAAEKEAA